MSNPTPQDEAFMNALKDALRKVPDMPAERMLGVASQFVGALIACQDQRVMTADRAMRIVAGNIEIGNAAGLTSIALTPRKN